MCEVGTCLPSTTNISSALQRTRAIMQAVIARSTLFYLSAVNAGSAGLFAYDKFQASRGGWRVPERQLCTTALAGGWAGGLMAMQMFRHKTRKQSFQRKYVSAITRNAVVLLPALFFLSRAPAFRYHFSAAVKGLARPFRGKGGNKRNPPRYRR